LGGGNAAIAVVHIKELTFCYRPKADIGMAEKEIA
jgi:hypothetical protein